VTNPFFIAFLIKRDIIYIMKIKDLIKMLEEIESNGRKNIKVYDDNYEFNIVGVTKDGIYLELK
jgi:penicillin-binding protein-related factor A (putative recombinase)